MEQWSDERYLALFGDEPTIANISDAFEFLTCSDTKTTLEYFATLPAVLRVYCTSSYSDLNSFWMSAFHSFTTDFDPSGLDAIGTKGVFEDIGYGREHVLLMIEMLTTIRRRFLLEDDPMYVAPTADKAIGQAIQYGISSLQTILDLM